MLMCYCDGVVRVTTTKGAKVEFTVSLIWYGKLPGERAAHSNNFVVVYVDC